MTVKGWENWIDEYGNWFRPNKPDPRQMELFDEGKERNR